MGYMRGVSFDAVEHVQREGAGQHANPVEPWSLSQAARQISDLPRTQPGMLGQFLLAQARREAELANQPGERQRLVCGHVVSPETPALRIVLGCNRIYSVIGLALL
jgi:hypothetical protein